MTRKRITRKLPAVMLAVMALVLIHAAHAPLMKNAGASTDVSDATKSFEPGTAIDNPTTADHNPGEIKMLLDSLANQSPLHPPLRFNFETGPQAATPVSLIPTPLDGTINSLDGVSAGTARQTAPGYTIPPYQPAVADANDGFVTLAPGAPTVNPPTEHHQQTETSVPETQVPEPAMVSAVICGWMMVRRTPRSLVGR